MDHVLFRTGPGRSEEVVDILVLLVRHHGYADAGRRRRDGGLSFAASAPSCRCSRICPSSDVINPSQTARTRQESSRVRAPEDSGPAGSITSPVLMRTGEHRLGGHGGRPIVLTCSCRPEESVRMGLRGASVHRIRTAFRTRTSRSRTRVQDGGARVGTEQDRPSRLSPVSANETRRSSSRTNQLRAVRPSESRFGSVRNEKPNNWNNDVFLMNINWICLFLQVQVTTRHLRAPTRNIHK